MIGRVVLLILLMCNTVTDLKMKRIFIPFTVAACGIGILVRAQTGNQTLLIGLAEAVIPGIFMVGFSLLTHGNMGMGDAVTFLAAGLLTDMVWSLELLAMALIIFGAAAILMLLTDRITLRDGLPFMPFILMGHAAMMTTDALLR